MVIVIDIGGVACLPRDDSVFASFESALIEALIGDLAGAFVGAGDGISEGEAAA